MVETFPDLLTMLVILIVLTVTIHTVSGCENLGSTSLRDKVQYSHIVIRGDVTGELDKTHYVVEVKCVYKDNKYTVSSKINLTSVSHDQVDGMCFSNTFKVGESYIMFIRDFAGELRSSYKEETTDRETALVKECGLGVKSPYPAGAVSKTGCPAIVERACPTTTPRVITRRTKPSRRTKPPRGQPGVMNPTTTTTTTEKSKVTLGKQERRRATKELRTNVECDTGCIVPVVFVSICGCVGLATAGVWAYKYTASRKTNNITDPEDSSPNTERSKGKTKTINVATSNAVVSDPPVKHTL